MKTNHWGSTKSFLTPRCFTGAGRWSLSLESLSELDVDSVESNSSSLDEARRRLDFRFLLSGIS